VGAVAPQETLRDRRERERLAFAQEEKERKEREASDRMAAALEQGGHD